MTGLTIEKIFEGYSPRYLSTANEYRMRCVFTENHSSLSDGKTSLVVNAEKNAYHCFSCGEHGTLIRLLTMKMGVSFYDALELVTVDNVDRIFRAPETKDPDKEFEADFILNLEMPEMFAKRGFTPRHLRRHKVSTLEIRGEEHAAIPWYFNNKLQAVKVRKNRDFFWVPGKFDKSNYLYNYDSAKKFDDIVITEGETDVWQCEKNGSSNVVGTGGGGFSIAQSKLCRNFENVYLAFDNDEAGLKSIEVANYLLSPDTRNIYILNFDSEDPGKCEKDEWQHALHNPQTYLEFSMEMAIDMGDDYLRKKEKWLRDLEARLRH